MNPQQWSSAPAELIQELGLYMSAREWAAARLVCRHWRAHVCGRVAALDLDLEADGHRWCMVLAAARRLFPQLRALGLLVGARAGPPAEFKRRMEELSLALDVKELEVRHVPMVAPVIGAPLGRAGAAFAELLPLESLKLSGGPTPGVECIEALSRLRRLRELEILPGDYGAPAGEAWGDAMDSPFNYGFTDEHAAAMEKVTSLTSLVVKVKPEMFTQAGLASLAGLPELKSLVVYDAELPSSALIALGYATKLNTLQVGVSDVDDVSPLKSLPNLSELYFDAVSLVDLRRLPTAMRSAGLTSAAGVSPLTGLYFVEQVFSSQAEFDVLCELEGLRELVLEAPAYRPANWPIDGAAPLPTDLARLKINVTGLSRLTALDVLQLDKRDILSPEDFPDVPPLEADDGWLDVDFSPEAVRVLASGWQSLTALDLYNLGPSELPAQAVAELTRLTSLRSLNISSCVQASSLQQRPRFTRKLGWWQLPPRLQALGLSYFDLSVAGDEAWHADAASIGRHFSELSSLQLHACELREDIFPAAAPVLANQLYSLTLCGVYGLGAGGLDALPLLTTLTTLRLLDVNEPPAVPLSKLAPLRLKQLKLRLGDIDDLRALAQMTSLFVLALTTHLNSDGVPSSLESRQLLSRVEDVVRCLPYADIDLQPDRFSHV